MSRPTSNAVSDPQRGLSGVSGGISSDPTPCGHCGRTSHGFACCALIYADEPGGCPHDHDNEAAKPPHRAPTRGQSGPPKPVRAPRAINPRRSR